MEELIIEFLKSFFRLFEAKIEEYRINEKQIFGTIGWANEEDKQEFVFKVYFETSLLLKVKLLCVFLYERDLINGDKIIVSEIDLLQLLKEGGWNEIEAKDALNCLCSLDVKMLDEGEETDSFFLHF